MNQIEKALSDFPDGKIIGTEMNKNGDSIAVLLVSSKNSFDIYLYDSHVAINAHPRLFCEVKYYPEINDSTYFILEDIIAVNEGVGNGSILLKYLIREARKAGASYISGSLSNFDKDEFYKLIPFYKKHGFSVTMNEDGQSGKIRLDLSL
jgi:hypothetical protein